jgi:hypothetical protein
VILDDDVMTIASLDDSDPRTFDVRVAGVASLLVAKLHKLGGRVHAGRAERVDEKDAADIYRLMLSTPAEEVAAQLRVFSADEAAGEVTTAAIALLRELFGAPRSPGVAMAEESLRGAVPPRTVRGVCTAFAGEVMRELAAG